MSLCQNGEVEVLMELGLASRQARVLLALTRLGTSTAKAIAEALNMSRQDVYKVLTELKRSSLVEKHLTKPTKFKAIPIKDIFSILINRRNQEIVNLKQKTNRILSAFEECSVEEKYDDTSQLILIPENETLLFRLLRAVENSKHTIDIISSGKPSQRGPLIAEALEKAIERRVKIRYVADEAEEINIQSGILQKAKQNSLFKNKIIHNRPNAKIRIFDKKEIFITLFPLKDFTKSPALWSNNTSFIKLFQDYFETVWRTGEEYEQKT